MQRRFKRRKEIAKFKQKMQRSIIISFGGETWSNRSGKFLIINANALHWNLHKCVKTSKVSKPETLIHFCFFFSPSCRTIAGAWHGYWWILYIHCIWQHSERQKIKSSFVLLQLLFLSLLNLLKMDVVYENYSSSSAWEFQSSAFFTLDTLSNTSKGRMSPITTTILVSRSTLYELTPFDKR